MLVHSRAVFVELGKAKAREGGAFAPAQQLGNTHGCGVAFAPAISHGWSEQEEASRLDMATPR